MTYSKLEDNFKYADKIAMKQLNLMDCIKPKEDACCDGLVHDGEYIFRNLKPEEFVCPRCLGTDCFLCIDAIGGGKFLSCTVCACMKINTQASKKKLWYNKSLEIDLSKVGVDEEFLQANFNDCSQKKEMVDWLKIFSKNPSGFVIFAGDQGRGKTYTACACMYDYLERYSDGRFIRYGDVYQTWLSNSEEGKSNLSFQKTIQEHQLLIIDDFGSRKPSEAFGDFIFSIIDKRKSIRSCGTIITTNLTSKLIDKDFGSPLTSRLLSGKCFKFEGDDRRQKRDF